MSGVLRGGLRRSSESVDDPRRGEAAQHIPGEIELPPEEPPVGRMSEDGGGCCATLAERHDRDQRGVAARISGLVAASTHDVRERVDEERGMPEHHGRQEESDDESAPPGEQERHGSEHPWADPVVSVQEPQLREPGHEPCRRRYRCGGGQDPTDVAVPEPLQRRVDVSFGVGVTVVGTVMTRPPQWALLQCGRATEGEEELYDSTVR